jgi:hypothetical protein
MKVSQVAIKVERKSGFFNSLGEVESLRQLRRFKHDAGLMSPADDQLFAPYMLETQGAVTDFIRRRVADLKKLLSKYDVRVVATETGMLSIAVNELHCPHVTGASATLKLVKEGGETDECSIEILGIGGGDEFKAVFKTGERLEADGACIATIHSIPVVFERCEMNTPDGRVQRFVRTKALETNTEMIEGVVLTLENDACQTANFDVTGGPGKREPINLLKYQGKYVKTLEIEEGTKWTSEAKIKLESFGINVGAKFVLHKTAKTELEYALVEGYSYVALKPPNQFRWLWRALPSAATTAED